MSQMIRTRPGEVASRSGGGTGDPTNRRVRFALPWASSTMAAQRRALEQHGLHWLMGGPLRWSRQCPVALRALIIAFNIRIRKVRVDLNILHAHDLGFGRRGRSARQGDDLRSIQPPDRATTARVGIEVPTVGHNGCSPPKSCTTTTWIPGDPARRRARDTIPPGSLRQRREEGPGIPAANEGRYRMAPWPGSDQSARDYTNGERWCRILRLRCVVMIAPSVRPPGADHIVPADEDRLPHFGRLVVDQPVPASRRATRLRVAAPRSSSALPVQADHAFEHVEVGDHGPDEGPSMATPRQRHARWRSQRSRSRSPRRSRW